MTDAMAIFLFSFNRGLFLEHCVRSIEQCAGNFSLFIIDDGSDDSATQRVLTELSKRFTVILNTNGSESESKTGGLYGCMNLAMQIAKDNNFTHVIFIQDDMQIVRDIGNFDLAVITRYFYEVSNSIQISTSFIRTLSAPGFFENYSTASGAGAYIRKPDQERGKSSFSATGVFSVARFHDLFHNFEVGEAANSAKARQLGLVCGRAIYPWMCWLPYPPSYRGKRKSVRHRVFEIFGRSGFYPINIMSTADQNAFLSRNPEDIPIMERYLKSPNSPRPDIWSTGGGEYNFSAYNGFFARIYKLMRSWKLALHNAKR